MKIRKSFIVMTILLTIAVMKSSAFGGGAYTGDTSPRYITIYHEENWSNPGVLDLRYDPRIPNNAVVWGVSLEWTLSSYGWSGMNAFVFNQSGNAGKIPYSGAIIRDFAHQRVKQLWSTKFWVQKWNKPGHRLTMWPKITIYWE